MSESNDASNSNGQSPLRSSDVLCGVKESSLEDCKQMWGFFDDMMPGEVMDTLMAWAKRGDTLEKMYDEIMTKNESKFVGMGYHGRRAMALAIEYAIRQAT